MNTTVYINGVKHQCTDIRTGTFYADHPTMPGHYCAQHSIGAAAARHLINGGSIRTAGCHYSMHPPMAATRIPDPVNTPAPFVQMRKPTPLPELEHPVENGMNEYWVLLRWRMAIIIALCALGLWLTR